MHPPDLPIFPDSYIPCIFCMWRLVIKCANLSMRKLCRVQLSRQAYGLCSKRLVHFECTTNIGNVSSGVFFSKLSTAGRKPCPDVEHNVMSLLWNVLKYFFIKQTTVICVLICVHIKCGQKMLFDLTLETMGNSKDRLNFVLDIKIDIYQHSYVGYVFIAKKAKLWQ